MPIKNKDAYPKDWPQIRQRILERDGHRCKICKVKNGFGVFRGIWNGIEVFQTADGGIHRTEDGQFLVNDVYAAIEPSSGDMYQKAIKVVLTTAHLNHDTTDNRDENLAMLCQLHHLRHDAKHHSKNARATIEKKKQLQRLF